MTEPQNPGITTSDSGPWRNVIRKLNLRPYFTGLLPLFILAHFGHHGVGAMMQPLMPMIRTDLGLSYTKAGFIMSAFTLTNGLSQLPAGWMADRFGARLMVLLGITGVAVAGFFIGFANSMAFFIVFLVLSALLGAGYHPASAAAIASSVPARYRGRSLGVHLIGGTSAFWVLPLLVTPIVSIWDWRVAFKTITFPIAILGVVLYILIGKRTRAIALERRGAPAEVSTSPNKVNWGQIIPFLALSVLGGTMIQSVSGYLSFYATDFLNVPESQVPLLMAISPAVGLVAAPLGGYFADRFGGIRVLVVLSLLSIPLIYLMGIASSVAMLAVLMVAMGVLMNTRMPTSESFIASNSPDNRRSTMLGIYFFAGTGVAGPLAPVIGNLIEKNGFKWTFSLAAAIIAGVTVLCSLFLWRSGRLKRPPEITG